MPEKPRKPRRRPFYPNQLVKFIVDLSIGDLEDRVKAQMEAKKNPSAVALGQPKGASEQRRHARQIKRRAS